LYESLGARNQRVAESVRLWLVDEAEHCKTPQREWTVEHVWCLAQENADDCGVFTVINMNYIAQGLDLRTMRRSTAYYLRRIAAELLAKSMGGKGWVVVYVGEMAGLHVSCFGRLCKIYVLFLFLFAL